MSDWIKIIAYEEPRAALRVVCALVLSKISGRLYILHPTNPTAFIIKLAHNTYPTNRTLKHTTETKQFYFDRVLARLFLCEFINHISEIKLAKHLVLYAHKGEP